ncbi:hypothetical protein [Micromonospora thermarum]|uniref:Minor tail protein n=1 Tax=Micromonospora thermarum TaxID=2720024 RepID=A0ABX0ZB34_9ACTN|nr:hypothetical protein [Micromonospora thermarum]NJP33679.1 hypothetical protein [Micromonospora thermarum]
MGVYPQSGLPAVVEIAPGADLSADPGTWPWEDVTADWRLRDGITISEGRGDWGEHVDAGSIGLVFDDRSGDYGQYNPAGKWYGLLGRDTPLRVRIRRGSDAFGRTSVDSWGISDSGQQWTNVGGANADYQVVPGAARHIIPAAAGAAHVSALAVDLVDVTVEFTVTVPVLATGAQITTGAVARWRNGGADHYVCEVHAFPDNTVQLQLARVVGGTFTTIRASQAVPGLTHAAGKTYRGEFRVVGEQLQARVWDAAAVRPAVWHADITDDVITGPGTAGPRSRRAFGNTNGTVTLSYSAFAVLVDLAGGYVPAWVPRRDLSGKDRVVAVTAHGSLYRLQASSGKPPQRSVMRRAYAASGALGYWPCEDGGAAGQVASAIPGVPAATVSGPAVEFADIVALVGRNWTLNYGTHRAVNLAKGATITAIVPAPANPGAWTIAVHARIDPDAMSGDTVLASWQTPGGTYERWEIRFTKSPDYRERLIGYSAADVPTVLVESFGITSAFSSFYASARQSGGNIIVEYNGNPSVSVAGTLSPITTATLNASRTTSTTTMPFGHLVVWDASPPPIAFNGTDDAFPPLLSYEHEPATDRLARLVGEDGFAFAAPAAAAGGAGGAQPMGWQPREAPLPLYRQAEDVDGGVLYERPFALAYQPRTARYNQPVALALDSAAGDLAEPPEPDPAGQGYRNRWTVSRPDGSSVVAETPEAASGEAIVYDDTADLVVQSDAQLADQAGWRLHLTSRDTLRWPRLELDLAATPHLIDAWLNCRIGSRIQVANPPADLAGQDIDVLLEGHTTKLGYKDWDVTLTCSPAGPWDVATVDGPQRVPALGSTLAGELAVAGTSLLLASTEINGLWGQDPADHPVDIRVGGERVTASSTGPMVSDPFTRSGTGWGVEPVSGLAWLLLGASSGYSTNGTRGTHVYAAAGQTREATLAVGVADVDVTVIFGVSVAAAGANQEQRVVLRRTGAATFLDVRVFRLTSGTPTLAIRQLLAGAETFIGFPPILGATAAGDITVKASARGGKLRAKAWPTGTAEPGPWTLELDVTHLAAGDFCIWSNVPGGSTNAFPLSHSFDDVTITHPQRVTLSARGVGGVQRTWPAGTPVDVWAPAVTPL